MNNETKPLFAVMREDSALESALVSRTGARTALVIASGGCTALDLVAEHPALSVVAFDRNPRQLALVAAKHAALTQGDTAAFGPGSPLLHDGHFEGLFRVLRGALEEWITGPTGFAAYFDPETSQDDRRSLVTSWTENRYFSACFGVSFCDELLHAMFGPAATQHAEKGSYPAYFQRVFEAGLRRKDGANNRFLQHVLLGRYLPADEPPYLVAARTRGTLAAELARLTLVEGTLLELPSDDLARADLVSLSNVFDWSDDALVAAWAERLASTLRPGAVVLVRKLNNQRDVGRFFAPAFAADDALATMLFAQDRSLFYEALGVFVRR